MAGRRRCLLCCSRRRRLFSLLTSLSFAHSRAPRAKKRLQRKSPRRSQGIAALLGLDTLFACVLFFFFSLLGFATARYSCHHGVLRPERSFLIRTSRLSAATLRLSGRLPPRAPGAFISLAVRQRRRFVRLVRLTSASRFSALGRLAGFLFCVAWRNTAVLASLAGPHAMKPRLFVAISLSLSVVAATFVSSEFIHCLSPFQ